MDWLIIIGVIVSAVGLVGIVVSLLRVVKAKRAGLDDAAMKQAITRALPLNMASFGLSALGMMVVVVAVILA